MKSTLNVIVDFSVVVSSVNNIDRYSVDMSTQYRSIYWSILSADDTTCSKNDPFGIMRVLCPNFSGNLRAAVYHFISFISLNCLLVRMFHF